MAVWKDFLSFSVFFFLFNYCVSDSDAPAGSIECPKETNNISASIKNQYSVIMEACRKELGKGETEAQTKLSFVALSPCIEPKLQEVQNISELEKKGLIYLFTCEKAAASKTRDLKNKNTPNVPSSERNQSKNSDLAAPAYNGSSVSSRTEPNAKITVTDISPSGENKIDGTTSDSTIVKIEGNKAETGESSNTVVKVLPVANETALSGNETTVAESLVSARKTIDAISNNSFVSTESGSDQSNTAVTNNSTVKFIDTTSEGETKVLPKKVIVPTARALWENKIQPEATNEISGSNLTGLSTTILESVDDSNISLSFNNTKGSSISSELTNSSAESISTTSPESSSMDITTPSTSEAASSASPTIAGSPYNSAAAPNTVPVPGTPVSRSSTLPADLAKTTQSGTPTSVQP